MSIQWVVTPFVITLLQYYFISDRLSSDNCEIAVILGQTGGITTGYNPTNKEKQKYSAGLPLLSRDYGGNWLVGRLIDAHSLSRRILPGIIHWRAGDFTIAVSERMETMVSKRCRVPRIITYQNLHCK